MEIPACGGVLVAERTSEHLELFEEGCEAMFFGSMSELTEVIARLAESETLRNTIAAAGRARVLRSGYDHISEAKRHLARIRSVMT
jgi:spore maturation protein CgeB